MNTEKFHRKLTAILSADVQGYSRLMEEDEDSTVRTLTAYRSLMTSLIQSHRGQVVDTPGDNLLAEFGSVMDAVRCAVEIQEELRIRNAELPDNRQMQFRIGINMGDVIEEGDHIYGDGVNIAARVEGLAEGGGICISGTVYDSIRNKLSWSYDFLGEHNVKNIKEPVRVYRIRMEPEAKTPKAPVVNDVEKTKKTIAVLPFDDLSPEKDQEYFVLGLSEEILNSLAQIPDLTVMAKTSSFSFKGTNKTIQEIAGVLGVKNILEGSVRKAGDALRITAQLVKAVDGSHLWSKTYDRELKEIFAVQEDIARAVAEELKSTLGIGKSFKRLGGTDNLEAYEQYLIAQGKMGDADTYSSAIILINKAIEMDPKFALAWAAKAWIHNFLAISVPGNQTASESDAALNAAQRAIELEPNLAAGYYSLGFTKMSKGDWIQAGSSFYKALDLQTEPSWSDGIVQAAIHYMAVANFKKADELGDKIRQNDPLRSDSRANYMLNLGLLGDIRRAEEEYERGKELFGGKWVFADAYIRSLRLGTGGIILYDETNSNIESWDSIVEYVIDYLGAPEKGRAELHRLYTLRNNLSSRDFICISVWAAYFSDPELAIEAMEKGVSLVAGGLFNVWLPVMKEVRQTLRFKEFVREIGLVDYWNQFGWPDICHQLDNGDFECD